MIKQHEVVYNMFIENVHVTPFSLTELVFNHIKAHTSMKTFLQVSVTLDVVWSKTFVNEKNIICAYYPDTINSIVSLDVTNSDVIYFCAMSMTRRPVTFPLRSSSSSVLTSENFRTDTLHLILPSAANCKASWNRWHEHLTSLRLSDAHMHQ